MNEQTLEVIFQLVGIVGAILGIASFQCKNNKTIFALQTLTSLVFALQLGIKGVWVVVIINVICALRNTFYFFIKDKKWTFYGTIFWSAALFSSIFLSIFIFNQPWFVAVFCGLGTITGTITYYINNGLIIRLGQLFVVTPCWLVNDITFKTVGGLVCEAFVVVSVIVSFIFMKRNGYDEKGTIRSYFLSDTIKGKLFPLFSVFKIEKQEEGISMQFVYHSLFKKYLPNNSGDIKVIFDNQNEKYLLTLENNHLSLIKDGQEIYTSEINDVNLCKHKLKIKFFVPYTKLVNIDKKSVLCFNAYYHRNDLNLNLSALPERIYY